jgi:hypothetical protein
MKASPLTTSNMMKQVQRLFYLFIIYIGMVESFSTTSWFFAYGIVYVSYSDIV